MRLDREWQGPVSAETAGPPSSTRRFDSAKAWFGSEEELVPFGAAADDPTPAHDVSTADDFWGERSAAVQTPVRAPSARAESARGRGRSSHWPSRPAVLSAAGLCAGLTVVVLAVQAGTQEAHPPASGRSAPSVSADTESLRHNTAGSAGLSPRARPTAHEVQHRAARHAGRPRHTSGAPAQSSTSNQTLGTATEPTSYTPSSSGGGASGGSSGGGASGGSSGQAVSGSGPAATSAGASSGHAGPSGSAPFGPGYPG